VRWAPGGWGAVLGLRQGWRNPQGGGGAERVAERDPGLEQVR
jgi:hypothetical protein